MKIANNITALSTYNSYTANNKSIAGSVKKLSTGYQINSAADNAAGLAISEKMRAQIRGLNQASSNSQDAISLVQTAEGALQSTHDILQRMRELAVQSASDTNETTIDRAAIQAEFEQLQAEIDDTASKTTFNGQNLIDGTFQKSGSVLGSKTSIVLAGTTSASGGTISVAAAKSGQYTVKVETVPAVSASVATGTAATIASDDASGILTIKGLSNVGAAYNGNVYDVTASSDDDGNLTLTLTDSNGDELGSATFSAEELSNAIAGAGTGAGTVKTSIEGFGDFELSVVATDTASTLATALNGVKISVATDGEDEKIVAATPASVKLSVNGETVTLKKGDSKAVFGESGITIDFGQEMSDADILAFSTNTKVVDGSTIDVIQKNNKGLTIQTGANQGDELVINIDKMDTETLGVKYADVSSQKTASQAITLVNNAINKVSTQRATLGALQNRIDYKIDNLDTSAENLTSAESNIRDVDMASEMTKFTNANILQQASTAMLAQANSLPQSVLSLLG